MTNRIPTLFALSLLSAALQAAEGMWLLTPNPPLARIEAELGLQLDAAWLAHQQAAAVNVGGASGSFVSAQGLVLTNHHVVRSCIDRLSSPQDDLAAKGFVAATRAQERRCPGLVLRVLQGVDDVSAEVPAEPAAQKEAVARLEAACTDSARQQRCQVVPMWGGARHHRYRYQEYADARLVMAPEDAAASFGGDDDNFHYPRFAFDLALLRAYGPDGQPAKPTAWLRPATQALQRGDAVFTIGHPFRTERLLPSPVLAAMRDVELPADIALYADEQAVLHAYAKTGAEAARQAQAPLAGVENRLKALRGELPALQDRAVMAAKQQLEAQLKLPAALAAQAEQIAQAKRQHYRALAALRPLRNTLLHHALELAALRKPAVLEEHRGARRAQAEAALRATTPFYPALETARLAAYLRRAQAALGAEHPYVQALLAGRSAEAAAAHWVGATRLGDGALRARLLDPALPAEDPLLQLAERLQPLRLQVLQPYEAQVTQALRQLAGPLAQARWQLRGDAEAPDANGTLRISYGRTVEVMQGGLRQPWKTTMAGLYARADAFDNQAPHDLSPLLAAQRRALLNLHAGTALNFISDNDIIGGNSGSPLVNAKGELVGLAFDGNAESLPGRFHYDGRANRTVSVHLDAIFLALDRIYGAAHLAREMRGQP